ncbi:MAG: MBL fold metallo-hydrolase [Oscillospiraceae bacterium]
MEFYTLASGSSGNCSLVCAGDTLLLIDAGISCRRIEQSLRALGRTLGDLTAVFITHEHADHVGGLATLSKKALPRSMSRAAYPISSPVPSSPSPRATRLNSRAAPCARSPPRTTPWIPSATASTLPTARSAS